MYLVFSLAFFGAVLTPQAEIYRWQDPNGVIQYSNTPPDDKSLILDVIPTKRVPLMEDANGTVYYLNVPDVPEHVPLQEMLDQVALPPEVLDELMQDAPPKTVQIPEENSSLDITALTFRLTELEKNLEREISTRLSWEQEYVQSQAYVNDLKEENSTLKLALTNMERKIEKLQKAVVLSDLHVSSLRNPQQELGLLESKIGEIESQLDSIDEQAFSDKLAMLLQKLDELEAQQPTLYDDSSLQTDFIDFQKHQQGQLNQLYAKLESVNDIKSSHSQQLEELYTRLDTLHSEITTMQDDVLSEQVTALATKLDTLEMQQQPIYDLRMKLANLQQEVETLIDTIPASQQTSEIVSELRESGYDLEAMTMHQAQQLDEQKTQIEDLKEEVAVLKTHAVDPTTDFAETNLLTLATLIKKNAYIESVINDQTTALHRQQEQIRTLETELDYLQFSEAAPVASVAPALSPTSGRIMIVERKIRRAPLSSREVDNFDDSFFQGFGIESFPIDRYQGSAYRY
jgi:chromosome segregation ATPase